MTKEEREVAEMVTVVCVLAIVLIAAASAVWRIIQ